jgi:hypothetical protein
MHDRLAAQEALSRWWYHYDAGDFDTLPSLLTDDVTFQSRTDTGDHPHEQFISGKTEGRDATYAWQRDHRLASPYPLRHMGVNIHIEGEREDEIDLASYLLVTQIAARSPVTLSTGVVHATMRRDGDGYRIARLEVVLDSIESTPLRDRPVHHHA